MKTIQKKTVRVFGKRHFLLGTQTDGTKVYLQEAKFDCDWYWGFGYIETFTNNAQPEKSRDISSHSHWDSSIVGDKFNNNTEYVHHINMNRNFKNTVLTDKESWLLSELMKSFYILRETSELYYTGSAHITNNETLKEFKDSTMRQEYIRINTVYIPKILNDIEKLLCDEDSSFTSFETFRLMALISIERGSK